MEVSKKSIYYRLEAEPSIEAKKQVLQATITSIEMLKTASNIKKFGKEEKETTSQIQRTTDEISKAINNLISALPQEEIEEHKIERKKAKKRPGKKEELTGAKQFEEELKEIKAKLSRLS